ncbi:MAG: hypothetical protein ACFE85_08835 [Candidatus Hodarchaeota archaeon]
MSEEFDFEKYWIKKYSKCLDNIVGHKIRKKVMKGSERLTDNSNREEIIRWSKKAVEKMDSLIDEQKIVEIMTGCSCQYPKNQLQNIKEKYNEIKDIALAHKMLQEQFEEFLNNPSLNLSEEIIKDIISKGWGSAGILKGDKVIATKIPKSGYIIDYYKIDDKVEKRNIYCHCPRVRDALKLNIQLPMSYCYCGAGFYKGIWEEILQKPVKVKILETVMKGDDVCRFEIQFPSDI